jgi:hypothetical protein
MFINKFICLTICAFLYVIFYHYLNDQVIHKILNGLNPMLIRIVKMMANMIYAKRRDIINRYILLLTNF